MIDKEDISATCRLCGERDETIAHIVSECKMLAQKQYKNWRHDRIAQVIHWELCKKYNMEHAEKWYEHKPEGVIENENVKMLWDMKIQTDREIEHSRPDILTLNKKDRSCLLIDVTCPFDTRVIQKEREKIEKYQDLKIEIKRIWQCKEVTIVPIVIGALGTVHNNFDRWIEKLDATIEFQTLQKACLLGSARILRYVLGI